jgi:hypothetical protein
MSENLFSQEQDKFVQGFQNNAKKVAGEFKVIRFKLDNVCTKDDLGGSNIFMTGFKSFWVCATNNSSFQASMAVNPKSDSGQALPIKANMSMSFSYPQAGCAIECPAQPGIWIDIAFAFNSDISPGFIQIVNNQAVAPANFFEYLLSPTATPTSLIPANLTRINCMVSNIGSVALYLGSLGTLNDALYATKAIKVLPGEIISWDNLSACYMRTDSATSTNGLKLFDEYN